MILTDRQRIKLREDIQTVFTDQQREKLCEDIQTVFFYEDKLKNIFQMNREKFGNTFYNKIPGTSYYTRVENLTIELENRGYMSSFIAVMREDYPDFAKFDENGNSILSRTTKTSDSTLQSYLLILVYPHVIMKIKNFQIKAEFIEDPQNNEPKPKPKPIHLNFSSTSICFSEDKIPDAIDKFIKKVEKQYLSKKARNGQTYDLKIELFLPNKLLSKRLEFKTPKLWQKGRAGICRANAVICQEYSVILRSLDRQSESNWLNCMNSKLDRIKELNSNRVFELNSNMKLSENKNKLSTLEKDVFVVKLLGEFSPKQTQKTFQILIEKGIPLCFLLTNKDSCNIEELDELTKIESLSDLDQLSEKVLDLRKKDLTQEHRTKRLGYNLSVLCDNKHRNPNNFHKNYHPLEM